MIPIWVSVVVIVASCIVVSYLSAADRRQPKWQTIRYRHRCRPPIDRPPYRGELVICRGDGRCTNWYLGKGHYWVRLSWLGKLRRNLL